MNTDAIQRLRAVVERLALPSAALHADRTRAVSDFQSLIKCLVQEIDETVLPRRLALFSDDRAVARMVASNRRLLELEIEDQKVAATVDSDASPEDIARAYAQALKALSVRSGAIVLRRIGRAPQAVTSSKACSARHLADCSETPYFEDRLKAFLKELHPSTRGWIFQSGDSEPVAHDPDTKIFDRLIALDEKVKSQARSRKECRHVDRAEPNCTAFAISEEIQALVVSDGKDLLIAGLPFSEMTSAMAQWSAIYGRQNAKSAAI